MVNKYYEKHKKDCEKKHVKDIKICLKKKKTKGKKILEKDIKTLLKKKNKKDVSIIRNVRSYLRINEIIIWLIKSNY